ncbi:MAG TPA: 5-oxoprolinase subunit PxpB [Candidatus Dormibacteraeota bacterium]|jgi:KipI family sensor histidine kinase inhibitor|nr:5-oxoprolinase subunit PxpB [Candidatus Dormibacteraeota bacterium]
MPTPSVHPLGDSALLVELGRRVDTALNSRAIGLANALAERRGVREAVAGYATVTVHYDPERISLSALTKTVERLYRDRPRATPTGRLHRIPVVYDGEDLADAADRLGLAVPEVIRLHTEPTYRCFMIGFTPGWAYLGPLPEALRLPRRAVPRTAVPRGAVAIAGAQTGVYPLSTPGGWHLIGRTSVPLFQADANPPCLFQTGDRVRFFDARAAS